MPSSATVEALQARQRALAHTLALLR